MHHVTLLFGSMLFAVPVLWLACLDRKEGRSVFPVIARAGVFAVLAGIGVGIVLLPYWIAIIRHPIEQMPIPHASRSNLLMNMTYFINYFVVPYGALILALPFILWFGSSNRRLRPLLLAFWFAFLFGLGGTTPVPKWILGRAFDILTFERFTLWAALLVPPYLRNRAENRPADSIGDFRHQLRVLQRTGPSSSAPTVKIKSSFFIRVSFSRPMRRNARTSSGSTGPAVPRSWRRSAESFRGGPNGSAGVRVADAAKLTRTPTPAAEPRCSPYQERPP